MTLRGAGLGRREGRTAGGFSLVELLVVVVIIAILAALLYPVVNTAQERGKMVTCLSNLRQWAAFWNLYAADHGGNFSNGVAQDDTGQIDWARGEWASVLRAYYLEKSEVLLCPKARERRYVNGTKVAYGGPFNAYIHGRIEGGEYDREMAATNSSYGMNCWLFNPPKRLANAKKDLEKIQGRPVTNHWRSVAGPNPRERVPLMFDSMWRGAGPDHRQTAKIVAPLYNGDWKATEKDPYNYEMLHVALDRHRGGVQMSFMDGSARHVPIKQLWKLKWHRDYPIDFDYEKSVGPWPAWMKDYPEAADVTP